VLKKFSPANFSWLLMWKQAFAYASARQKAAIFAYHLFFVGATWFDLQQPRLMGMLVNALQAGGPELLANAARILGLIVLCSLGAWALHGPARVVERRVAQEIYIRYVTSAYAKVVELPLKWHQDHHSGATINRISTAALGLRGFIETGFISIQMLAQLAGSILILFLFNARIGLLSLGAFCLSILVISALNRRMAQALHASNETAHQANAVFFDFVSNVTSIVVLRLQKFSESTLGRKLDLSMPSWMDNVKVNEWKWFLYSVMMTVSLAFILLGYIYAQARAGLGVAAGALVTIYLYQDRISRQASGFVVSHTDWLRALTAMEAMQTIFDDHARLAVREESPPPAAWRTLSLKDADFSYGAEARAALAGMSLDLRRGEKIALIGGSGAGKSTLISLLRGLHAPDKGAFSADGAPCPFGALAQITTLIPQDPEIFENTIRFNVSFGLDAPDETVMEALKLAEFDSVLAQLPAGLDTDIREKGVNLSVGQKQRLALARGLFAAGQSDIILLDEPTSSVDLPTEERIFTNVFRAFKGKTIVATLHRLHLLPQFDRIVCLERGRVISDLPATESLRVAGPVRDLYAAYQRKYAE
jgi:ABC-type multidrug transport system fused ATPase/permease subunit